jgi:hypothetical protein
MVNIFKILYQEDKKITSKINIVYTFLRILNNCLKPSVAQKQSRLKVYNTFATPSLMGALIAQSV